MHVLTAVKSKEQIVRVFLSGGAGVGKSLVTDALYQAPLRYLCSAEGDDPTECRIIMCAPTGKVAFKVKGTTVRAALFFCL